MNDSETEESENILPGIIPLVLRLDAILTEAEMKSEDLELNGDEQRGLGKLFRESESSIELQISIAEQIYSLLKAPLFSYPWHRYKEMRLILTL